LEFILGFWEAYLYLKNINVVGFKSFGGKNVLDFPEFGVGKSNSLTSVVGPNGSGKSNITDAIRWVLGEQSTKLLRIKKGEDIVFFGSAKKGKGSFAEVSLTLDNSGRKSPVDFAEIEIARRLYRNGDNEYFLNKRKVRLLDIQELLAKCGFGRSTYTVIGQGMVDSLLFYGPSERKVLFEEASGVKQYELKRAESIRKLDSTDKNIIRIKDLLYELEPRLRQVDRQNRKFQKKQEIEEELETLSRKYYAKTFSDISKKRGSLDDKLKKLKGRESELKSEISSIEGKIAKALKASGSDKEERAARAKIEDLSQTRDDISRQIYRLQAEAQASVSVFSRDKESIERERDVAGQGKKDLEAKAKSLKGESIQLAANLVATKEALKSIDNKIIGANEELSRIQRETLSMGDDDITKELEAIYGEYRKVLSDINSAKSADDFSKLKKDAEKVSSQMDGLISRIKKSHSADTSLLESKQEEIRDLSREKEGILREIQDLRVREISQVDILKNIGVQIKHFEERQSLAEKKLASLDAPAEQDDTEIQKLLGKKQAVEEEIQATREDLEKLEKASTSGDYSKILEDEKAKRREASEVGGEISGIMVELAKVETREEDMKDEINEFLGQSFYKEIQGAKAVPSEGVEHLMPKIQRLRKDMYALGEVDPFIGEEFEELSVRVGELSEQLGDLEKAKGDILTVIGELDQRIKTQFKSTFSQISEEFANYFKILFDGGKATLSLETNEDGEFGIEISATPPGKKNQSLNSLSGGERALTSIALLFAILSVNPSPFCVLDEVDASLDETNTERFLQILKRLSQKTQFIVVTHNRETMKKADIIYGVTMDDNHVSQVYSLKLTEVGSK